MKTKLLILFSLLSAFISTSAMKYRGVVYDVGLQYNPGQYSVETFNPELAEYDMNVIARDLHANAVRIEGEDVSRLVEASEIAHKAGLKVFFNPWWMNAGVKDVVPYMAKAAEEAEKLRLKGVDITFVTGCEFTLFNKGIFDGDNINDRLASLMKIGEMSKRRQEQEMSRITILLNTALGKTVKAVRKHFNGPVTYSSGTWETVAWNMFDIVGIDHYRDTQTEEEYLDVVKKYQEHHLPVWVMEVGCCTFEGAAKLGGGAFTVCQGVDENGNGIYVGGKAPARSEKEQADYNEQQIRLLNDSGIEGMFIFEFSFPIAPYRESGHDADLTAYPIVKSFPSDDPRSLQMPPWVPKEAFHRVAAVYKELKHK